MEIVKEIETLPQTQFYNPFIFATKLDYLIQKNFAISEVYTKLDCWIRKSEFVALTQFLSPKSRPVLILNY